MSNGFVIFFTFLLFALGIGIMIAAPMLNKITSEAMTDAVKTLKKNLDADLKREISTRIRAQLTGFASRYANPLVDYSQEAIDEIAIEFFGKYVFTVKSELSPIFLGNIQNVNKRKNYCRQRKPPFLHESHNCCYFC